MKALNKIGMLVAVYLLAMVAGLGVANAGEVTVKFKTFPDGPTLDKNVISSGCDTATADTFPDYEFLFWDNQGSIVWTKKVDICVGSGDTTATAWYLPIGGGPCPDTGCYMSTFAFSMDHDEVLTDGTPIALVSPNSPVVWTSGSQSVLTAGGPENLSAFSALAFPSHKAEPFRYWQQLGTSIETPPGIVYEAAQNSTAIVIAFYGPDPCAAIEAELQSCMDGDGPHGKLNCAPIGKELALCQKENREVNASAVLASMLEGIEK
jgi:hypothetical protein